MTKIRSIVRGVGEFLPKRIVFNHEFEKTLDTTDEWIRTRTGIEQRRFAADDQSTSNLAVRACESALEESGLEAKDIDLIVLATSTPDNTFPSTATKVQADLGMRNGFAFDVQAVCAGFVYATACASAFLKIGSAKRALVVGAEIFSRILDMRDRGTCILFGDGAGAIVLEAAEENDSHEGRGILATDIHSDGRYRDLLYVDGGVSTTQTAGYLRMEGPEIFKHAVAKLADTTRDALNSAGLTSADVDWFVPHQANLRIINATAKKLGIPESRVIVTLDKQGNTSAASIPLALSTGTRSGRIKQGDIVATQAIGGGLAWGSVVFRW